MASSLLLSLYKISLWSAHISNVDYLMRIPHFKQPPPNIHYAALVIGGSFIIEGMSAC